MDRNVFPAKEAGDYMNNRAVFVIKDMAKIENKDKGAIFEEFKANVLPTFIVYNGDGVELSRFSGGVVDVKSFIALIEKQLKPENYSAAREKRYKEDSSYAFEYISELLGIGMNEKAMESLDESFGKMSDEERFSEKWLRFYSGYSMMNIVDSHVFKYIYENGKKVETIMGKEKFSVFMKEKANQVLYIFTFSDDNTLVTKVLKTIAENPVMETGFTKFIASNQEAVSNKDATALITAANKAIKKSGSNTRSQIVNYIHSLSYDYENQRFKNEPEFVEFIGNVIDAEKDIVSRQQYYEMLDRISMSNKLEKK